MHPEAHNYVERMVGGRRFKRVLEIGSRDINGTVRDVVSADYYHGIDIVAGPGVDEVADATSYRSEETYDAVICCEVLEHLQNKVGIIDTAQECLRGPGCCKHTPGLFIITCATDPREPHSAIDGGPVRDGEWYSNVDPSALTTLLNLYFVVQHIHTTPDGDLYVTATKR